MSNTRSEYVAEQHSFQVAKFNSELLTFKTIIYFKVVNVEAVTKLIKIVVSNFILFQNFIKVILKFINHVIN